MKKIRFFAWVILAATFLAISSWAQNPIKHVVFIVKENRSFDNYFGTYPGANGATQGTLSNGQQITLQHMPDAPPHDSDHTWYSSLMAEDNGKMDRFDLIPLGNVDGDLMAYSQLTGADIPNYFAYAQNFVLADNMYLRCMDPACRITCTPLQLPPTETSALQSWARRTGHGAVTVITAICRWK